MKNPKEVLNEKARKSLESRAKKIEPKMEQREENQRMSPRNPMTQQYKFQKEIRCREHGGENIFQNCKDVNFEIQEAQ